MTFVPLYPIGSKIFGEHTTLHPLLFYVAQNSICKLVYMEQKSIKVMKTDDSDDDDV